MRIGGRMMAGGHKKHTNLRFFLVTEKENKKKVPSFVSNIDSAFEIGLYFGSQQSIILVVVFDDGAVFEQGDARADVERVGEVVGRDDDCGLLLLVVGLEQVFHSKLRCGVEEVERLVEQEQARMMKHGAYDAHFLLVAHREVADEGVLAEHFAVHERVEPQKALAERFVIYAGDLGYEAEIFFWREVIDQESRIDKRSRARFPLLAFGCVARHGLAAEEAVYGDVARVGLEQVEDDAE